MEVVAIIALLNSVVSLYYYIKILKCMFIDKSEKEVPAFSASYWSLTLVFLIAAPVIIFGIYFTPLVDLAKSSITLLGL